MDDLENIKSVINPFILPSIMIILFLFVGTVCLMFAVKLIKRQIKLYNSITLVKLRMAKFHYWAFIAVVAVLIVYIILQLTSPTDADTQFLLEYFNMERMHSAILFTFALLLLICIEFLLIVIAYSKSAVVDKGVYTLLSYLDWYNVHDYLIDEEKCVVVLSSDKETFATTKGTTPPLKVAKNDVAKLKFILNKNKNKFSGFSKDSNPSF